MSERIETIYIVDKRLKAQLFETASILAVTVGPIVLGRAIDSTAAQWVGFLLGTLAFIGFVSSLTKKIEWSTIEEARARLDELEREQAAKP